MAGLNGLKPMPPNSCLAMTMAKALPSTVCHQGSSGGSAMAISQAVTTALRSMRTGPTARPRSFSTAASAATAVATAIVILISTPHPKYQNIARVPGSSASSTMPITRVTLCGPLRCGELVVSNRMASL